MSEPSRSCFEDFLFEEYRRLADAHFDSGKTITQFFQFYLIALTVPITVVGVITKVTSQTLDIRTLPGSQWGNVVWLVFLVIAVLGVLLMAYIVNLRMDALLYARALNGIRNYFFTRSGVTSANETELRVLPRDVKQPSYFEPSYFLWVVLAFALVDALYVLAAFWTGARKGGIWIAGITFVLHISVYGWLAYYRENRYLKPT